MKFDLSSFLFPRPKFLAIPALGLDISDKALKYVLLERRRGKIRLNKYGEILLEPGIIMGGVIRNREVMIEKIKEVRSKVGNIDFVSSVIPEEKGYVVDLMLPTKSKDDLRDTVELHLEESIPLEPSKAVFDYEVIGESDEGTPVVLTAVEAEFVAGYEEVIREGGFMPLALELESSAIARALVPINTIGTYMILDIGRGQSNLSIVSDGKVRMSSGLSIGGDAITKAIMDDLGVGEEEASALKTEQGLMRSELPKMPLFSIVRVATILRDEIYQRISYWSKAGVKGVQKSKVERLIMCGGNSNIPGLPEYLTSGVDIPVSVGNPWANIADFEDYIPDMSAKEALRYCAAMGLALRAYINQ